MAGHRPAHEALILSRGAGSPQNPDHHREENRRRNHIRRRRVPHERGRISHPRLSTGSSSPRIDNFIVQDIAADDE